MFIPVNYLIAKPGQALPPLESAGDTGRLYEYVMTARGLMLRGKRDRIEVVMPWTGPVRGLREVEPHLRIDAPPVPAEIVHQIFEQSKTARGPCGEVIEALFNLCRGPEGGRWELIKPEQTARTGSVRPDRSGSGSSYRRALIEVHSHHDLPIGARFSGTDDSEENGFRIYAVVGHVSTKPEIRVRVGMFGQFWETPAGLVFELPPYVTDCVTREQQQGQ